MTAKEKFRKETKATIDKLHAKYYGEKKTPMQKINEKIAKAGLPIQFVKTEKGSVSITRNELMLQAKEKGIKNFRILNKDELAFVICDNQSKENIDACVIAAVARWKSGWGSNKQEIAK